MAAVRRIADAAWAGGATPIVVVSFDPAGRRPRPPWPAPGRDAGRAGPPRDRARRPRWRAARGCRAGRGRRHGRGACSGRPASPGSGPRRSTSPDRAARHGGRASLRPTWDGMRPAGRSLLPIGPSGAPGRGADRMPPDPRGRPHLRRRSDSCRSAIPACAIDVATARASCRRTSVREPVAGRVSRVAGRPRPIPARRRRAACAGTGRSPPMPRLGPAAVTSHEWGAARPRGTSGDGPLEGRLAPDAPAGRDGDVPHGRQAGGTAATPAPDRTARSRPRSRR